MAADYQLRTISELPFVYHHPSMTLIPLSDPNSGTAEMVAYQDWLAAGNVPDPADDAPPIPAPDANARLDAGIAAAESPDAIASLRKRINREPGNGQGNGPPQPPPNGWPPGLSSEETESFDYVMGQMIALYDQMVAFFNSYASMVEAQKTTDQAK